MNFEAVIGLEVHAQLNTRTKIFCGCSTEFGATPNSHTCPVCLGMPGVLPVLNREVVEKAIRAGLATNCTVNQESRWDRKNYFYPDLPKGYQISQYEKPICEHGHLDITLSDGQTKRIGITRIHMEEDAGKSSHDPARPVSRVDLNRTGVPLIEIVSEPDMRTPEEAGAYLRKLHAIVKAIGVCDGNMEEGSFRCDANVSIRPVGQEAFGTRAELKNLNSFKFIEKAIQYEINRQVALVENGDAVVQETRLWDTGKSRTISMRGKEEAHDYRYFPDPDLLPLIIDPSWIERVKGEMPELPEDRKNRFIDEYGLPAADADVLTGSMDLADYYEACLETHKSPKPVANWIMGTLLGYLNSSGLTIDASPVSPERLAELVQLIDSDVISGNIAKTVFDAMIETGDSPKSIVEKKGLTQVTDTSALESALDAVLARCPDEVAAYKDGKTKLMSFFMGQVMRETKGKANPKVVTELLKSKLS